MARVLLDEALRLIIEAINKQSAANANAVYHLNKARTTVPPIEVDLVIHRTVIATVEAPPAMEVTSSDYGLPEQEELAGDFDEDEPEIVIEEPEDD